jgi:hypothetical protein
MVVACPKCGTDADLEVPSAVLQPLLDELGYDNPATLASALDPDESVLVQCRAFVGGLAGTTHRVLIVKSGSAHTFDYEEIRDINLETVGRFVKSDVCQLVTESSPYRSMKVKEARGASDALELRNHSLPLYERARSRLLEVRDRRKCQTCGAFVPISRLQQLVPLRVDELMEPLSFGEAETVASALEEGEYVCCQIHGERYAKCLVVTDRRALVVIGSDLHSFEFGQLDGVEVQADRIRLIVRGRTEAESHGPLAAVRADNMVPLNEPDLPKFQVLASVIRSALAPQTPSGNG